MSPRAVSRNRRTQARKPVVIKRNPALRAGLDRITFAWPPFHSVIARLRQLTTAKSGSKLTAAEIEQVLLAAVMAYAAAHPDDRARFCAAIEAMARRASTVLGRPATEVHTFLLERNRDVVLGHLQWLCTPVGP